MTFEEAKNIFLNRGYIEVPGGTYYDADKWRNAIAIISKWLEQQPCEDVVSRKDVHDMLENLPVTVENKWFNWLQKACIRLAELPSVTPKEKSEYEYDYDVRKAYNEGEAFILEMTLDEAIKHSEEAAEEQEKTAKEWHENQIRKCKLIPFAEINYTHENECKKCAEEHRQLAKWLKELKQLREQCKKIEKEIDDSILICQEHAQNNNWCNGELAGFLQSKDIINRNLSEMSE